ncbi:MAG TPA: serine/threonine-protein kinase, partial [Candidatus Sulfotelmatobacter sp.]|nr:serine/threonine-protein kinase [Candidatus Sulfotelmatobacter sp.]
MSAGAGSPSDAPTLIDTGSPTGADVNASDAPTLLDAGPALSSPPRPRPAPSHGSETALPPGTLLGQRYEIVALLGEGGMGAVYEAIDRELNRPVALKVIRPELAKNKAIIDRFKQELLLAREVTHRNVIRIYDLGEADRIKFITMEFVQGEDLRTMLVREKKLAPEQAVDIIQQICRALEAAHSTGIIHRDLKPQNVMRDKTGRILVMDFGLARMVEGDGMTQTGALVGTMDYMSPEQALGKPLDQRSDIYAVGLIFYELLTGMMPFAAESALASLIKRTQERATPALDCDKSIPVSVSNIVAKCLERDVKLRYQSATELLADLDAWYGKRAGNALTFHANVGPWARGLPWPLIAAVLTAFVLAASGWLLRGRLFAPKPVTQAVVKPEVSLAILPFRNASGDASLDWLGSSLSDMLSTDVGQSARLRTISPERLHQVLS